MDTLRSTAAVLIAVALTVLTGRADDTYLGACCLPLGCMELPEEDCRDLGGTFQGLTTRCTDDDTDGDGMPDACDGCPDDPVKIVPGACGCGIVDPLTEDIYDLVQYQIYGFESEAVSSSIREVVIGHDGRIVVFDQAHYRIQVLDPSGEFLFSFGSQGAGDGELSRVKDLAVDAAGRIYVADTDNHRVQVFDHRGVWLFAFGGEGDQPGQFDLVSGVAVHDSTIYVVDATNDDVQMFDLSGSYLGDLGEPGHGDGQIHHPYDIATTADGCIHLADSGRIMTFTPDGEHLSTVQKPSIGPASPGSIFGILELDVDSTGRICITDAVPGTWPPVFRVQMFAADGDFLFEVERAACSWRARASESPSLAFGPNDNLYVTEASYRFSVHDQQGHAIDIIESGDSGEDTMRYVNDMCVDPAGRLWVADTDRFLVRTFDAATGTYQQSIGCGNRSEFPGEFGFPLGVDIDVRGRVYVAEGATHRVQVFDHHGNSLFTFGHFGSGDGQFYHAAGVALDRSGHVYVTDYANHRVQVFSTEGEFRFAFGEEGQGPGQFRVPRQIAIDPEGRVLVADDGNQRVQVLTGSGEFLFQIDGSQSPTELSRVKNVATDAAGRIFIADSNSSDLHVFDRTGNHLISWNTNPDPRIFAIDRNGGGYLASEEYGVYLHGFGATTECAHAHPPATRTLSTVPRSTTTPP